MSVLHNKAAEAARNRELRRAVVLSGALHVVIGTAFYFAPPLIPRSPELPGVITIDLVALPALAAAAAPRSAPAPVPPAPTPPPPQAPPKPIPPPQREVVIPETPRKEVEPKPKEPPKPKDPPKPEPRAEAAPPPPDDDVEYDDLLSQLRAERGEEAPEEVARAEAPAPAPGGGGTNAVSAEVARWLRLADRHVKRFWVVPLGLQDAPLVVHLDVKLGPGGDVQGEPRITRRSGNPWFDEGAVRAVQKASPLPAPPEAGTWAFVFRPEDLD